MMILNHVIDENKAKAFEEQKEMRDDVAFYVLNCSVFNLQRMFKRMKELKNEKDNFLTLKV